MKTPMSRRTGILVCLAMNSLVTASETRARAPTLKELVGDVGGRFSSQEILRRIFDSNRDAF